MNRRVVVFGARAVVLGIALGWTVRASASTNFPSVVEQYLALTQITVGAPMGCTLCHKDDNGGLGTLRPFGALLKTYGAMGGAGNTGLLEQALAAVDKNEMWLIEDIKVGKDPNLDDSQPLPPPLPTPEHGCSTGGAAATGGPAWLGSLLGLLLTSLATARRRARGARAHGSEPS